MFLNLYNTDYKIVHLSSSLGNKKRKEKEKRKQDALVNVQCCFSD